MTLPAKSFQEAWALVGGWRQPVLITHEKPDGDALGSLMALQSMLRGQGIDAEAVIYEPVPERYAVFQTQDHFVVLGAGRTLSDLERCDGVIVLDTCTYNQLRPVADWLRSAAQPKLAVDHHVTRDDLAQLYLVDESAAATCLILYDWARSLGWTIDPQAARSLFVGLATDTGWFHHSNTDARALSAAADLVSRGVAPYALYEELFQRDSAARVRLLGAALASLEILCDGQLAVMSLDRAAFSANGALPADTEDIINEPLRIASVKVSVLLVDAGEGVVRVSLRSRASEIGAPGASPVTFLGSRPVRGLAPTAPIDTDINVAAVAQALGGGGHRNAAGVRIAGTLAAVRDAVLQSLQPLLTH